MLSRAHSSWFVSHYTSALEIARPPSLNWCFWRERQAVKMQFPNFQKNELQHDAVFHIGNLQLTLICCRENKTWNEQSGSAKWIIQNDDLPITSSTHIRIHILTHIYIYIYIFIYIWGSFNEYAVFFNRAKFFQSFFSMNINLELYEIGL